MEQFLLAHLFVNVFAVVKENLTYVWIIIRKRKAAQEVCPRCITTNASKNCNFGTESDYLGEVSDLNDEDEGIYSSTKRNN